MRDHTWEIGLNTTPLLPAPAELHLSHLAVDDRGITVVATTRRPEALCPRCGMQAVRVHSRYTRRLADLPWHGLAVQLVIATRRYFCDQPTCVRRIFTERLPATAAPSARRTLRLTAALDVLGLGLGGEAGARVAERLGMATSGDTVRRVVLRAGAAAPLAATPRVLGVDDWAWRRRHAYGTLLVDLERRCVVDLLPDRRPETVAAWLRAHPGIEIISRDRGGAYADAARAGAPDAVQVADRFHLVRNLVQAVDRVVTHHHTTVRAVARACGVVDPLPREAVRRRRVSGLPHHAGGATREERLSAERRARRLAHYEQAIALRQQGRSLRLIAREVGVHRRTLRRWLASPGFPERRARRDPPRRLLDRYAALITARYDAGLDNGSQLHRELSAMGCSVGVETVRRYLLALRRVRPRGPPPAVTRPAFTVRQTTWLLHRPDAELTDPERSYVAALVAATPALGEVRQLALAFRAMFTRHDAAALQPWLLRAAASELRGFARSITQDRDAVLAAIVFAWSNGPVEGHVHRLKLLKRQSYGRAGFALLRQRVRRAA